MVSDLKKQSKFERYGSVKPRNIDSMSRNFVVITNSNSPKNAQHDNSLFSQTDGFSYNQAETGIYLQSLTQIPRNQTFSAEPTLNTSKRNYIRK